ncbi:hypothetical protein FLONG3_4392 [Fusarium longipes]|uniref:Uncharacterized protein n=1 Tax=Fusarium longipes TaxID=694270 RepID=A0A395SYB9_9HYPO|nr:hypothetical protein FLONG3_4392 [Fusarium longipes]
MLVTPGYSAIANAVWDAVEPAVDTILEHVSFNPYLREVDGGTPYDVLDPTLDVSKAGVIIEKLANRGVPAIAGANSPNILHDVSHMGNFPVALSLLRVGYDGIEVENDRGILRKIFLNQQQILIDQKREIGDLGTADKLIQERRELLKLLIQRGADVNRQDEYGWRNLGQPLYWALLYSKDYECVRIMLDAGARISDAFVDEHSTSEGLLRAFFNKVTGWCNENLYPNNASVMRVRVEFESYEEPVKLLLERGARIDASSHDQESALIEICYRDWDWEDCTHELEFVAKHARLRNVSAEYVEGLMKWKNGNTRVRHLLEQLYEKLRNEEYWNDRCLD